MSTPGSARKFDFALMSLPMRSDFCVLGFIQDFADDFKLMRGHAVSFEWPSGVAFHMDPDFKKRIKLSDALLNANDFLIASVALRNLLEAEGVPDVEFLPVTVFNHKKKAEPHPYWIVNPVGLQDCVDLAASDLVMNNINPDYISVVKHLVIDETKVSPTAALFRARRLGTLLFVRRDLAQKIQAQSLTGLQFKEIDDYKS